MTEAIGSGAIGTGAIGTGQPDRPGCPVEEVARLQAGADAGTRGYGAGPVGRLLAAVAGIPEERPGGVDPEFHAALLDALARRYLAAVRRHARDGGAPRVWQVVLHGWESASADPDAVALAAAHALACHDLPPAVVSACTLLGRRPGAAERAVVMAVVDRLTDLTHPPDQLCGGEAWRQAEHLWSVRGRPSEAEKERAALDRRAALVARALLGV